MCNICRDFNFDTGHTDRVTYRDATHLKMYFEFIAINIFCFLGYPGGVRICLKCPLSSSSSSTTEVSVSPRPNCDLRRVLVCWVRKVSQARPQSVLPILRWLQRTASALSGATAASGPGSAAYQRPRGA